MQIHREMELKTLGCDTRTSTQVSHPAEVRGSEADFGRSVGFEFGHSGIAHRPTTKTPRAKLRSVCGV